MKILNEIRNTIGLVPECEETKNRLLYIGVLIAIGAAIVGTLFLGLV